MHLLCNLIVQLGLPGSSDGKESAHKTRDPGSSPGSGRSPGEGKGNPLQYSGLGYPKDRGAWRATVYGVAKELNTTEQLTLTHSLYSLAISFLGVYLKEMNHMSIQRYV